MIIEFSIKNFGSIKDKQTLSFEATKSDDLEDYYVIHGPNNLRLLKMAMIYGANASGKTTILMALEFLRDLVLEPEDKKTELLDFKPFLFDPNTPNENSELSIDFLQNNIRYSYQVAFTEKAIITEELYYFNPNKARVYSRTTDLDKQFSNISFGSKIKKDKAFDKVLEANTLWNNTVLGGFLKTNLENHELTEAQTWFQVYLRPLILTNTSLGGFITRNIDHGGIEKKHVVEILKKADFHISDIIISKSEESIPDGLIEFLEKTDKIKEVKQEIENLRTRGKVTAMDVSLEHYVEGAKYRLPLELESQGTRRYYGFAGLLALLIKNSVVFPIDELESSLHPDLYLHFILSFLINVKSSQLLFTTHNRELLNRRDVFRNDVIWFANKGESCATELYSLADFNSSVIRDTSNVYNAYKTGKLGGIPNLGDYYIDLDNEE